MDRPISCRRHGADGGQPEPERGKLGRRDSIPYQTANRLPVSNQDFLGFWTVAIHWEGHRQRSAPQKRHAAHQRWASLLPPGERRGGDQGCEKMHWLPEKTALAKHLVA